MYRSFAYVLKWRCCTGCYTASQGSRGLTYGSEAASSSAGPSNTPTFDEVMAAIAYRTPESQSIEGLRRIREEGLAIQAKAKAERESAAPHSRGQKLPPAEDLIGYTWDEDATISVMYGVSDDMHGAHDAEGMIAVTKNDIPTGNLAKPPKRLERPAKHLIGIVRGAIGDLPSRGGKWIAVRIRTSLRVILWYI